MLGPEHWCADRFVEIAGMLVPIRMTVLRGPDGRVLVYAPVAMDEALAEAVDGLGQLAWVVVPNRHHTSFACDYLRHFSQATAVGPPFENHSGLLDEWRPWFDTHVVRPCDGFVELCGFHLNSRTLVLCDLSHNIASGGRRLSRLLKIMRMWRRFRPSPLQRLAVMRDQAALNAFFEWAMARPFVRISMAHGDVVSHDAREAFYQAFLRR